LDEATTGMDPINKRATLAAIREQARAGRTIFLTTHILEEAEELCDTIAIIDRGKCLAMGNLPAIKSLIPNAFDISITFDELPESLAAEFRALPLLKLEQKHATIEARIRAIDLPLLETISRLARGATVRHFEVRSATLEDVFVGLLGSDARASVTREPGAP
jgi:ABC-2 type transport system ATP-binding protein